MIHYKNYIKNCMYWPSS